jgi:hypothetical protein
LLVVFATGGDATDATAAAPVYRLSAAVIDTAASTPVTAFSVAPFAAEFADPSLAQRRPAAARVGDVAYLAFETQSPADAGAGAQLFLERVAFDASQPNGVLRDQEMRLPYPAGGTTSSNVHFAASALFPTGALISTWEEANRAGVDLALDFRPSPFVFLRDAGSP